jgi:hypothetical protein
MKSVRYHKHFYRLLILLQQLLNLSKEVYQRPDYSKFKNENYAASDHAGLRGT